MAIGSHQFKDANLLNEAKMKKVSFVTGMQKSVIFFAGALIVLLSGCASVPMASIERDSQAKTFAVKPGLSNIYVYRNESMGAAVKMDVELDGKFIGQTAAKSYFALEVSPGKHILVSKAENDSSLEVNAEAGKNNFVWQEVKMGLVIARTKLQIVDEETGKAGIAECKLIESVQTNAAPQQALAPAPANTASGTPTMIGETTSQKLRDLQALRKDGIITEDEFQKKKQQLLEKL